MARRWYEEFSAAQSDGTLPNKRSARAMRYRRAMVWQVVLDGLGIESQTRKGGFTVEITNDDGSILFFKQRVEISLFLVSLGVLTLQLFTWNYVKDEFDTEYVAGVTTTSANIGQFLEGGTAQSEQGDMRPASGQESTNAVATIIADWYSPIYRFDRGGGRLLPPNYKVKISRDSWNLGPASVEYGWAFEDGAAPQIGTAFDGFGALLSATVTSERIQTARAWGVDLGGRELGARVNGENPSIHELRDGRELLTLQIPGGVAEFESRDSEWTWSRVRYPDAENPDASAPLWVWEGDVSMPLSLLLNDQSRLHIAMEGSLLVSRLVDADGIGERVAVGPIDAGASYSLEEAPDGRLLVIGPLGTPVYVSQSQPLKWTPIPQSGTGGGA